MLYFPLLFLSFLINALRLGDAQLSDHFHYGEWFAAFSSLKDSSDFVPLAIHGAVDWLPALLAINLTDANSFMHLTHLIYLLLDLASCLLLWLILREFYNSAIALSSAALLIPFLIGSDITGFREFSLLLLIYIYLIVSHAKNKNNKYVMVGVIAIGLVGVFNFFYTNNRGIVGTLLVGIVMFVHAFHDRRYLTAIAIILLGIIGAGYFSPVFSLSAHFGNIAVFSKTSYQWSLGTRFEHLLLSAYLAIMLISSYALILREVMRNGIITSNLNNLALSILLAVLSLFYFQYGTYRADTWHVKIGLVAFLINLYVWLGLRRDNSIKFGDVNSLILMFFIYMAALTVYYGGPFFLLVPIVILNAISFSPRYDRYIKKTAFCGIFLVLVYLVANGIRGYNKGEFDWIRSVAYNIENQAVVPDAIDWVASELLLKKASCVFDLTNSGVINAASGLPACTRFSYVVYADLQYEEEVLEDLKKRDPSVIVYSTDGWMYAIDGRPMNLRFPKIDSYVRTVYLNETCEHGYCVRFK